MSGFRPRARAPCLKLDRRNGRNSLMTPLAHRFVPRSDPADDWRFAGFSFLAGCQPKAAETTAFGLRVAELKISNVPLDG